jgi:hypothetical protein
MTTAADARPVVQSFYASLADHNEQSRIRRDVLAIIDVT